MSLFSCRRVAELEGLDRCYVDRRIAGLCGNVISDAQHGRLAAAVLLDRLVADASCIHALEDAWGQPNTLTKAGTCMWRRLGTMGQLEPPLHKSMLAQLCAGLQEALQQML